MEAVSINRERWKTNGAVAGDDLAKCLLVLSAAQKDSSTECQLLREAVSVAQSQGVRELADAQTAACPAPQTAAGSSSGSPSPIVVPEQVRLSEILISTPQPYDTTQVAEAQHKAEEVRDAIRRGGAFADLAKANSQGPMAAQGGDIGYFTRGELAPSLEDLVFRMKMGEVSEVVRTKQGFLIIEVTEHHGPDDLH
jgi:parvulin-like peptidyl-prolyl isomerase